MFSTTGTLPIEFSNLSPYKTHMRSEMVASVARPAKNITDYRVSGAFVHRTGSRKPTFDALSPGVKALPVALRHEVLT
jgi:hypothetical protein